MVTSWGAPDVYDKFHPVHGCEYPGEGLIVFMILKVFLQVKSVTTSVERTWN